MNPWVIAFPCLMYLGSLGAHSSIIQVSRILRANIVDVVMGVVLIYQNTEVTSCMWSALPCLSISISLNILLTLMIVIQLILHTRNTCTAMGGEGISGVYQAIVTMLIESCTLYAVSSLLVIGSWGTGNYAVNIFFPILTQTQVGAFPQPRSLGCLICDDGLDR